MTLLPDPPAIVDKIDTLVAPAAELDNTVLVDHSILVRWAGPLFALFSIFLVPWIIFIAASLPERTTSPNYDIAWAGYDVMLLVALVATAYCSLRRSRHLTIAATAAAVLLVVDSWFDVLTSPGDDRLQSIALAVLIELPLAALCMWLSHHSHQLAGKRLTMLLRRTRRGADDDRVKTAAATPGQQSPPDQSRPPGQ